MSEVVNKTNVPMVRYIGTKMIEACPMTRGEYNVFKNYTMPENENSADEGYLVKYSDDYISWSPKKQFEEAYVEVGKDILTDTTYLMKGDYKQRFRAEYFQVVARFQKLVDVLSKWDKNELDFEPTCPRSTYNMQVRAMSDYIAVLEARAMIEGIQL